MCLPPFITLRYLLWVGILWGILSPVLRANDMGDWGWSLDQVAFLKKQMAESVEGLSGDILSFGKHIQDQPADIYYPVYPDLAGLLKGIDEFGLADELLEKAIAQARVSNRDDILLKAYIAKADLLCEQKEFEQGAKILDLAASLVGFVKDPYVSIDYYSVRGAYYNALRQFNKSTDAYQHARDIIDEVDDLNGKAQVYKSLSQVFYSQSDYEKSLNYALLALDVYEALENEHAIALSYELIASCYACLSNYSQAIDYSHLCLTMAKKLKETKLQLKALGQLSNVYRKLSYLDKSLEYALEMLRINESIDYPQGHASACLNLGLVYEHLGNYDLALDYYYKALQIAKKEELINIQAAAYKNIGGVLEVKGLFTEALNSVKLGLELHKEVSDSLGVASAQNKIGKILYKMGRVREAESYLMISIENYEIAGNPWGKADSLIALGRLMMESGDKAIALKHLTEGASIAEGIEANSLLVDSYKALADYYKHENDYTAAFDYSERYIALKESIGNQEVQTRISNLLNLSKIERKQREIDLLKAEKQIRELNLSKERDRNDLLVKEQEIQRLELEKEQQLRRFWTGTFCLSLIMVGALMSRYRYVRKTQLILQEKNAQIELKNQQLELLNSDKDRLFSIIAHDLRNSFGNLMAGIELLKSKRKEYSEAIVDALVSEIGNSSKNTYGLLENLLEWAKIQMNKLQLDAEVIKIYPFMGDVLQGLQSDLKRKDIEVIFQIEDGLCAYADSHMIATVMRNLIHNAIKFTSRFGTIKIKGFQDGNQVCLQVIDSGVGMDPNKCSSLFGLDGVGPSLGTEGEKGSGLGLLLCAQLVQINGGSIKAESKKGEGSCFTVSVPLWQP